MEYTQDDEEKNTSSNCCVHRHDEVEAVLYTLEQQSSVVNIDVKLTLECVVNQDAGLDIDVVVLRVPVCLEGYGDTIPSLRVSMSQTITNTFNDALGQNSGLFVLKKDNRLHTSWLR